MLISWKKTVRSEELGVRSEELTLDMERLAPLREAALRPSPCRRRGTAAAVDEVCDSPDRPTLQVTPTISGA